MPTDWDKIAEDAANAADDQFSSQISSLTRLNDDEIQHLLAQPGINKEALAAVLKVVNDATKSNEAKAKAIKNIGSGIQTLVAIAAKLL